MARILVAGDEDSIRYLIQILLSHLGHEVIAVENGSAALDVLKHDTAFNIVISDMQMPEINGIELIQVIKDVILGCPLLSSASMTNNSHTHGNVALTGA